MTITRIYPKSYKTVERVIAHSYHPESFPTTKNRTIEIVSRTYCGNIGIDFQEYKGGVEEIPKNLLKKKCGNLIQLDYRYNNQWFIVLK